MPEKLIPLFKDGQPVEMAMTRDDFFRKKTMPVGTSEFETAAEAGYRLGDRYEDLTEYDGPKSKAQYASQQEERRAARAAEAPKPEAAKAEAPKAEAKKDA